jgi:hypothetical protein
MVPAASFLDKLSFICFLLTAILHSHRATAKQRPQGVASCPTPGVFPSDPSLWHGIFCALEETFATAVPGDIPVQWLRSVKHRHVEIGRFSQ